MRNLSFLVAASGLLTLAGCSVGFTPDTNQPVVGFSVGDVTPVATAVKDVSGFLPAPWDKVVYAGGTLLAGWGMHNAGRTRGKVEAQPKVDAAYDEGLARAAASHAAFSAGVAASGASNGATTATA